MSNQYQRNLRNQELLRQLTQRQSIDSGAFGYGVQPNFNQRNTTSLDLTEFYNKVRNSQHGQRYAQLQPYNQTTNSLQGHLRDSNDLVPQPGSSSKGPSSENLNQFLQGNQNQNSVQFDTSKELSNSYHNLLSQISNSQQEDSQKQIMIFKMEENLAFAISQKLRQGSLTLGDLPKELQDIYRRHSVDTTYTLLQEAAAQQNMMLLNQQRKGVTSLDIPMALRALYNRNPYQGPTQQYDIVNQITNNNEILARQQQQQQQQQMQKQMSAQLYGSASEDINQILRQRSTQQQLQNDPSEQYPRLKIDQLSGLYHGGSADQQKMLQDEVKTRDDPQYRQEGDLKQQPGNGNIGNDNVQQFLYQDPSSYAQQHITQGANNYDVPLSGTDVDWQNNMYGNQNYNMSWLNMNQLQSDPTLQQHQPKFQTQESDFYNQ